MALDPKLAAKITVTNADDSAFAVEFPKSPDIQFFLISANLHQAAERHERLTLYFKGVPTDQTMSIAADDPVIFKYRRGLESATFNGYVHSITQENTQNNNETSVTCVGATYYMKDTDQQIYKNVSADQVVSKIAKKYGFTPITQIHPRKRKSIVQAGLTDWQMLTSLARQTGYALYSSNTFLVFMSKDKIYNDKKVNAPYFFYVSEEDAPTTPFGLRMYGTILNYTIEVSDQSPESGRVVDRVLTGRNQLTGSSINDTIVYRKPTVGSTGAIPGETYYE